MGQREFKSAFKKLLEALNARGKIISNTMAIWWTKPRCMIKIARRFLDPIDQYNAARLHE